jgi:hypothetical protein
MNATITSSEGAALRASSTLYPRAPVLWKLVIFATWTAMVTVGELYHAFWRDEIRALSLALDAPSLTNVPARIHGEGHPALWYLLLRISYDIFGTQAVLPVLSILIAAAAVIIFLWKAPFPSWFKAIFVLSAIPAYEYSVMARNYGISMLLMFAYTVVYTSPRRPAIWSGLILFLLSQTNVIASLMIPFYLVISLADWWSAGKDSSVPTGRLGPLIFVALAGAAGMLAAFATVYPPEYDLMLPPRPDDAIGILHGVAHAILVPGHFYCGFSDVVISGSCSTVEIATSCVLFIMVAGLAIHPPLMLAGLGSLWTTSLFFRFGYPGAYRHEGIWFVFLITLFWFALAKRRDSVEQLPCSLTARLFSMSLYGIIPAALLLHNGISRIYSEMTSETSKSRVIGNLLRTAPGLRDAVVLAEPEQIAEAIPYYANNDIFLVREDRFGKFATWSSHSSKLDLTLRDLLNTARALKEKTDRPVLILLGYQITSFKPKDGRQVNSAPSLWRFSYDQNEVKAFLAATQKIPLGPPASLENFDAYLLR